MYTLISIEKKLGAKRSVALTLQNHMCTVLCKVPSAGWVEIFFVTQVFPLPH